MLVETFTACYSSRDNDILLTLGRLGRITRTELASSIVHSALECIFVSFPTLAW